MADACETGAGVASAGFDASRIADVVRISERRRRRGKHPLSQPCRAPTAKMDAFSDRRSLARRGPESETCRQGPASEMTVRISL
eukprot:3324167-Pyramimonas_sp.AAC.1